MTRRREGWDYCAPGDYMVTLVLADRTRGWLGELGGGGATVELSELGRLVEAKWLELAANWPGVEVADYVIMPDHLHGILRIRRRQTHPLGQIVGSFKARLTSEVRRGLASTVPGSLLAGTSLWAEGLTDSILWTRERYERAKAYIADNPRRLALKRNHPELFAIRRDFAVPLALGDDGKEVACRFAAIGNAALLNSVDFHQVQCSRRYFAYAREGAAEIDYKGLKPNFIDRSAKEACLAAA